MTHESIPCLKVIHNRILALLEHGLADIWMRFDGEDYYHISSILGIDRDVFVRVIDHYLSNA